LKKSSFQKFNVTFAKSLIMFTKADIEKYFFAEKQESLLFLIIGIIAIAVAVYFFFIHKGAWQKGMAIPLLLIGLIQAIVGYTVYARSDKQRIDNVYAYDMNPSKLKMEELPRMQTVNKNFVTYRWVEIALLLAGLAMVFLYRNNIDKQLLYGVGIALALQSAIMLGADYFAESRAKNYTNGLTEWLGKLK
jgi:drug/metabolite transporter (DMT)-like permease